MSIQHTKGAKAELVAHREGIHAHMIESVRRDLMEHQASGQKQAVTIMISTEVWVILSMNEVGESEWFAGEGPGADKEGQKLRRRLDGLLDRIAWKSDLGFRRAAES